MSTSNAPLSPQKNRHKSSFANEGAPRHRESFSYNPNTYASQTSLGLHAVEAVPPQIQKHITDKLDLILQQTTDNKVRSTLRDPSRTLKSS